MVNAQEYINNNLSKDSRVINVVKKNLTGSLDLREYSQLEELIIEINQITNLIFSENNKNIIKIEAYDNRLTNLNFLAILPNPEKLKWLGLFQNQITSDDLEVLTPFVNCEMLSIGKNNICGNLCSLRYWTKLKRLDMLGINPGIWGLEYIVHNPFDWENHHSPFGQFFQDYVPRNREELNSNDWRGSRTSFRESADDKICETVSSLWWQTQHLKQQLNQTQVNNQNLQQQNIQLNNQLDKKNQELSQDVNKNKELERQLVISRQENQVLQDQNNQNQQTITNLNQTLAQVNNTNSQLNQQISQQQQIITQLQTELSREKNKNNHLLEQLTQIEQPPK